MNAFNPSAENIILIVDGKDEIIESIVNIISRYPDLITSSANVSVIRDECALRDLLDDHSIEIQACFFNLDTFPKEKSLHWLERIRHRKETNYNIFAVYANKLDIEQRVDLNKRYRVSFCYDKNDASSETLLNVFFALGFSTSNKTMESFQSCLSIIHMMSMMVEMNRPYINKNHTENVGKYSYIIAKKIDCSELLCKTIQTAAQLHDLGFAVLPDYITKKEGELNALEYERMKEHTLMGEQLLSDNSEPVFQIAAIMASTHHERWNGTGYPRGLREQDIPIEGRIVAVADVFDSITARTRYKEAHSIDDAFLYLEYNKNVLFDPEIVDAFIAEREKVEQVFYEGGANSFIR